MKTSNQAIRNLGRHARHVATIGFTSLGLAAVLSGPVSAQTHHSGERSDDFTMMPRNMTPLQPTDCSTGKIAVGSTCVDVSSGATTGVRSWVSYFLGQTRPLLDATNSDRNVGSAKINANGTVTFTSYKFPTQTVEVPYGSNGVGFTYSSGACSFLNMGAGPSYTASEKLAGSPPSNWTASAVDVETICPPPPDTGG